jgi:hypothetical protein
MMSIPLYAGEIFGCLEIFLAPDLRFCNESSVNP